MATYLLEISYTAESIAAQIKKPQDRLKTAAVPVLEAAGGKLIGGGFSFGDPHAVMLFEAPNDQTAAAVTQVAAVAAMAERAAVAAMAAVAALKARMSLTVVDSG